MLREITKSKSILSLLAATLFIATASAFYDPRRERASITVCFPTPIYENYAAQAESTPTPEYRVFLPYAARDYVPSSSPDHTPTPTVTPTPIPPYLIVCADWNSNKVCDHDEPVLPLFIVKINGQQFKTDEQGRIYLNGINLPDDHTLKLQKDYRLPGFDNPFTYSTEREPETPWPLTESFKKHLVDGKNETGVTIGFLNRLFPTDVPAFVCGTFSEKHKGYDMCVPEGTKMYACVGGGLTDVRHAIGWNDVYKQYMDTWEILIMNPNIFPPEVVLYHLNGLPENILKVILSSYEESTMGITHVYTPKPGKEPLWVNKGDLIAFSGGNPEKDPRCSGPHVDLRLAHQNTNGDYDFFNPPEYMTKPNGVDGLGVPYDQ